MWWTTVSYEWLKLTYTTGLIFACIGLVWAHAVSRIPFPWYYFVVYILSAAVFVFTLIDNTLFIEFAQGDVSGYNEVRKGAFFDIYTIYMFSNLSLSSIRPFIFLIVALVVVVVGFNIVGTEALFPSKSSTLENSTDFNKENSHLYFLRNVLADTLQPVDFNLYDAGKNWNRATWTSEALEQSSLF
mgnify:FL=1